MRHRYRVVGAAETQGTNSLFSVAYRSYGLVLSRAMSLGQDTRKLFAAAGAAPAGLGAIGCFLIAGNSAVVARDY